MVTQVDDDFAAFVRSRQRALLRAAYLVCGDGAQAEDVVQEAFAKLASRWTSVRDGSPDAYVRRRTRSARGSPAKRCVGP